MYVKPLLPYLLLSVALVGSVVLVPVSAAFALWEALQLLRIKGVVSLLAATGEQIKRVVIAIDVLLNVLLAPMLNRTMVQRDLNYYAFGAIGETMSKAYGINKDRGTLSRLGELMAGTLNWLEPNHVELAAGLPNRPFVLTWGQKLLYGFTAGLLLAVLLYTAYLLIRKSIRLL